MLLDALEPDPRRKALAVALIARVPATGWRRATLDAASKQALGAADGWRAYFPRGTVDAIWYVSTISDASMKLPFLAAPAASMSQVILTRLDQNAGLKPFVRRVMLFDFIHPFQAFARMHRTARVMFECLPARERGPSFLALSALNVTYTAVVFFWLFDGGADGARTAALAQRAMRLIGLS
jgi:hypothetical protein